MSGRDWGLRRGCGEERRCGVRGRGRYARAGRTMGEVGTGWQVLGPRWGCRGGEVRVACGNLVGFVVERDCWEGSRMDGWLEDGFLGIRYND